MMKTKVLFPLLILSLLCVAAAVTAQSGGSQPSSQPVEPPVEKRLRNVRQLTDGGENAEAYFSGDGRSLIFQSKRDGRGCDQIYTMRTDGSGVRMVSTGEGTTTCAYLFPSGRRILYASTHLAGKECPPPPDRSQGYVWAVYPGFDIFSADEDGRNLRRLTSTPGYDAEATMSSDGRKIVFTSVRDGDLDIYSMDPNGRNVRRLTSELGYDGGPFFSRDGKRIVYRAYHPKTPEQVARYKKLLSENVIEPANFEIWVMDADGRNKRRVTNFGAASFAPYFTPDGRRIIFSSNLENPRGRNFDLYLVNLDGTGLERVTYSEVFDGFPMFSPDGRRLVFASNRDAKKAGDTNVFIADWVETPEDAARPAPPSR
jgi:Tol biopolymer transport system component